MASTIIISKNPIDSWLGGKRPDDSGPDARRATDGPLNADAAATQRPLFPVRTGYVFTVRPPYYDVSPDTPAADRTFTLTAVNLSGAPIEVVLTDTNGGEYRTGHFNHSETAVLSNAIQLFYGQALNKILRWRPGFLGAWGCGGGDIHFSVPTDATSAAIDLVVVG